MNTTRHLRVLAAVAVGALALTACGGDDEPAATAAPVTEAPAPAPTPAPETEAPTAETPAESGPLVSVADTSLGPVIVAADGLTLYMFDPDNGGAPTCTGGCAGNWPPYVVQDGAELTAGDGLDASLLGTVAHPDGGTMLTYNGWPLYTFAADSAPGDVNGQGVNDVWWVLDATGTPVK